jgi:hypothetical protein
VSSQPSGGPGEPAAPGNATVDVAARLVRHRNRLSTAATTFLILFALGGLGYVSTLNSDSQPAPHWFLALVIAFGVLGVAMALVVRREDAALRRLSPEVRARARALAGRRWSWRVAVWSLLYLTFAFFLGFLVISVPMTIDSAGYLAKVGPTATFTPRSYNYSCDDNGNCTQVTDGVIGSGASASSYTWPNKVPLDRPFRIYRDLLPWPPLDFNFTSDGGAIGFLCIGLMFDLVAVAIVVFAVKWRRGTLVMNGRFPRYWAY